MQSPVKDQILRLCQNLFPQWAGLAAADFEFDDPKGFSSYTIGIRARQPVQPDAVLYRRLAGKDNAILDFATEKEVFLTLGANDIAAHCYHYDNSCRIEAFYPGRNLLAEELFEPQNLQQIAGQLHRLHRLHRLKPAGLPQRNLFELLHDKWGRLAKRVLERESAAFPPPRRTRALQRAERNL